MGRSSTGSTSNWLLGTNAPVSRYPVSMIGLYRKAGGGNVTTEQCPFSISRQSVQANSLSVEIDSGNILALAGDGVGFSSASKSGAVADGQWHSFCAVFRDLAWRVAGHDGVFGTPNTTSRDFLNGAPTINRVAVGGLYWAPVGGIIVNPFLTGDLAEFAILQTALSEPEYLAWHNKTLNGRAYTLQNMRPGTCRAYYPLNDGTGNEANYASRYGNVNYDLTLQGAMAQSTHPTVATFAPDGMWRPLLSNQRVWTNGVTETLLAGPHSWMGFIQHMYLTRQSVSDSFDRGLTTVLGSDWTNEISAHLISNNTAEPTFLDTETVSRWTSATYVDGADQFAVTTVGGLSGVNSTIGPVIRCDSGALNMYWVFAPTSGTAILYKRVAGVDTSLGTFAYTAAAGDIVYLDAIGTTVRVYVNTVLKLSVTDSAVASGRPGFRTFKVTGGGNQVALWRGGNLASSTTFYPQDFAAYLDVLVGLMVNYTRLWGWDFMRSAVFSPDTLNGPLPWARSSTAGAYDGGNKFDLTTLDTAYFTRLVACVEAARLRNITVSVVLWEMSLGKTLTAGHPFTSTNNINGITGESGGTMAPTYTLATPAITTAQDLYLDRVLTLLGGYWNVQYELGNEPFAGTTNLDGTTSGCDAWLDRMSKHIREYEIANCTYQHMVVASTAGGVTADILPVTTSRSGDAACAGLGWGGFTGTPNFTIPESSPSGVWIVDSDHLNNGTYTVDAFMRAVCQGYGGLLFMEDGYHFAADATGLVSLAIRRNLGYILNMTRRMRLATARPSSALASTGFCLSTPGTDYFAYQPGSAAFTVNLSSASGTLYVDWLNTNDGTHAYSTVAGGSAAQTMTPPFAGSPTGVAVLISTSWLQPFTVGVDDDVDIVALLAPLDALRVGVSEVSVVDVLTAGATVIDAVESLGIRASDLPDILARLALQDSVTVTTVDGSTITVSVDAADSSRVVIGDATDLLAYLAVLDAAAVAGVDAPALVVLSTGTDAAAVAETDTTTLLVSVATTDSAAVVLQEGSTLFALTVVADALGLSVADASALLASLDVADLLTIQVADVGTMAIVGSTDFTGADATPIVLIETTALFALIAAADVVQVQVAESAALDAALAVAETVRAQASEVSSLLIAVATPDTAAVVAAEQSFPLVSVTPTDTPAVAVSDQPDILAVVVAAADVLGCTAAEAYALLVSLSTSESLPTVITTPEGATVAVAGNAVSITASDGVVLATVEAFDLRALLASAEEAVLGLIEEPTIAATVTVAESVPVPVTEAVALTVLITQQEAIAVGASDLAAIMARLDVEALVVVVADESAAGVADTTAADASGVAVTEEPVLAISLAATAERLGVTVDEVGSLIEALVAADTTQLFATEQPDLETFVTGHPAASHPPDSGMQAWGRDRDPQFRPTLFRVSRRWWR